MWDVPQQGLEPVSPALAEGLLTTAPPGKSLWDRLLTSFSSVIIVCIIGRKKANSAPAFCLLWTGTWAAECIFKKAHAVQTGRTLDSWPRMATCSRLTLCLYQIGLLLSKGTVPHTLLSCLRPPIPPTHPNIDLALCFHCFIEKQKQIKKTSSSHDHPFQPTPISAYIHCLSSTPKANTSTCTEFHSLSFFWGLGS